MSHYTLCVQGLHCFTLTKQCLDKSVGSIMALLKRYGNCVKKHLVYQVCLFKQDTASVVKNHTRFAFRIMFNKGLKGVNSLLNLTEKEVYSI